MKFLISNKSIFFIVFSLYQVTLYSQTTNVDIEKKWKDLKSQNNLLSKENESKGIEKNNKNSTKFKLIEIIDKMSDLTTSFAIYENSFGKGSVKVELICQSNNKKIIPLFTFYDVEVITTLEQLGFTNEKTSVTRGRTRVNGKISNSMFVNSSKFSNQFSPLVSLDENYSYVFYKSEWIRFNGDIEGFKRNESYTACKNNDSNITERLKCQSEFIKLIFPTDLLVRNLKFSPVYDYAFEYQTEFGAFFIEINPFDPPVRKIIESCVR